MSLLSQLKLRKDRLKSTKTIITHIDGQRYLQCDGQVTSLPNNEYGFVVDTKPDDIPAQIIEHLYLGSQDCCELKILEAHNIHNVLSVGIVAPFQFEDVHYKFVQCLDLPESDISYVLQESIPYIDAVVKQNSNILVHCNAGVSRSSSVVIGYVMYVKQIPYSEAYAIVKEARSCIQPNLGFQKQLQNFDFKKQYHQ